MNTSQVTISLNTATHVDAMLDFLSSLTSEIRYQRFLSHRNLGHVEATLLTEQSEQKRCFAVVVDAEIVAHGMLTRDPADKRRGEIGIVVVEEWQRCGIGYSLTTTLLLAAQADGIEHINVIRLAHNQAVNRMMKRVPTVVLGHSFGVLESEFSTAAALASLETMACRPNLIGRDPDGNTITELASADVAKFN